nr:hypothetical protein [Tanacetum cinerariifolium]
MFDEYFNPPLSVASPVPIVIAPDPTSSIGSPSSTSFNQDVPSLSTSQTPQGTQPLVIPFGVEEEFHDIKVKDIKENDRIEAKTRQNQEQTESIEKSKVKPDEVKA